MPGRASTPAFVGRTAELAALVDAFGDATAGHGTTVLVGGEAGVGKSRLVGEAAAHARRRAPACWSGQCLDLEEGGLPYAPIVDVLRTLDRELSAERGRPRRAAAGAAGPRRRGPGAPPGGDGEPLAARPTRSARPACSSCCSR